MYMMFIHNVKSSKHLKLMHCSTNLALAICDNKTILRYVKSTPGCDIKDGIQGWGSVRMW